jgi:hypothetical protein
MTPQESQFLERRMPAVPFSYPDETPDKVFDRDHYIRALEWAADLAFSGRTPRVGRMTISVCLALLKNDDLSHIAEHFHVTQERVAQIARKVKATGISHR